MDSLCLRPAPIQLLGFLAQLLDRLLPPHHIPKQDDQDRRSCGSCLGHTVLGVRHAEQVRTLSASLLLLSSLGMSGLSALPLRTCRYATRKYSAFNELKPELAADVQEVVTSPCACPPAPLPLGLRGSK